MGLGPTPARTYRHHCPTGASPGWGHHRHPVAVTPLREAWALAVVQVHEDLLKAQTLQLALAQGQLNVINPTFQPALQEGEIWNGQGRQDWRPVTTVQGSAHPQCPGPASRVGHHLGVLRAMLWSPLSKRWRHVTGFPASLDGSV